MPASFVRLLKKFPSTASYHNMYRGRSKAAQICCHNLELYLELLQAMSPEVLLVGEAPGYKGCKRTGVPFSSEGLLMSEKEHPVLGSRHGYKCISSSSDREQERSARMVWASLDQHKLVPLIWNIFPFHPFVPENPASNRSPRRGEIRMGTEILHHLLNGFSITHILAVGKKAHLGLEDMSLPKVDIRYIRHPSFGGKRQFEEGMALFSATQG